MRIVRINKGKILPLPFRFVFALLITVIVIKILETVDEPLSIFIAMAASITLPAVWFSTRLLIIDMGRRLVFDGSWVMGRKFGKTVSFQAIDKVFINRIKTKQSHYSLSNNQQIVSNHEYQVYIKLDSGEKFFLISHPLESRAIEKAQYVIHKLSLGEQILDLPD